MCTLNACLFPLSFSHWIGEIDRSKSTHLLASLIFAMCTHSAQRTKQQQQQHAYDTKEGLELSFLHGGALQRSMKSRNNFAPVDLHFLFAKAKCCIFCELPSFTVRNVSHTWMRSNEPHNPCRGKAMRQCAAVWLYINNATTQKKTQSQQRNKQDERA